MTSRASRWGTIALGALGACAIAALGGVPAAAGAQRCAEPGAEDWERAAPAAAGMDGAKLDAAIAYATANQAQAVRIYRYGCRVAAADVPPNDASATYQSWSLAKSVTALVYGRALTQNLAGPDDPLGSLLPVADAPHGRITLGDLVTMTSGLEWNGFRDYNIFMPNRIQEGLTVPVAREPGTYWEYSQSGPALLAAATGAAVGDDFQAYAQRELFGPLGIEPGTWTWERDEAGNTQGFFGLHMTPDDFARLGELMRRGGVWQGERLLSKRFVRDAVAPIAENGCYGRLIWVNASKPCVGPRITERPVDDHRMFPTLPADAYQYAGLFGQLVTVFPSQGLIAARFGNENGAAAGGPPWEEEFYRRVLGSIVDEPVEFPKPAPDAGSVDRGDVDHGFVESLQRPDEILAGERPPPLPPAGPARARATVIKLRARRPGPAGKVKIRLRCPREWPADLKPRCRGVARLTGARGSERYRVRAGRARTIAFELRSRFIDRLGRVGREVTVSARNRDRAGGTKSKRSFILLPRPPR